MEPALGPLVVRVRFAAQNATQGEDKGGIDFAWLDL